MNSLRNCTNLGLVVLSVLGCAGTSQSVPPESAADESAAAPMPASSGPLGDPVALWPGIYKVLFENEYVRLLDVQMKPSDRDDWHGHPASAGYVLTGGTLRTFASDGTFKDVEARPGMAAAHPPIPQHRMENIGPSEVRILFT